MKISKVYMEGVKRYKRVSIWRANILPCLSICMSSCKHVFPKSQKISTLIFNLADKIKDIQRFTILFLGKFLILPYTPMPEYLHVLMQTYQIESSKFQNCASMLLTRIMWHLPQCSSSYQLVLIEILIYFSTY